ncbi:cell surface glycoprotein CD200 receptor 1-like [Heliangelus exortis]|uniref:cell surface glycoprotein CD200 receptor 1-like n=1 Tax=Heliangelus exortis TaxID=472823 RepID=UPI003A95762B
MWEKRVSFPRKLLCPTMFFSLLYWAGAYLLPFYRGCLLEETAPGLNEAVKSERVVTAALGGEASLYCNFSLPMEVLQVTWQKRNGSSFQNLASYSLSHGPKLIGSFQEKAFFTRATLKASAIVLQNLTFEDESNYRCIFNVFPHGSFSQDICLNIQTLSELTVEYDSHLPTKGLLTAVCSATGKPAPKITWLGERGLDKSPEIHHLQNANGTVMVSSRLTFPASHLSALTCLLEHPQGRKMMTVYLEKGKKGRLCLVSRFTLNAMRFLSITCVVNGLGVFRQKRCTTPRSPSEEEGLQQDLREKAISLHVLKDQHVVHQSEEQTPSSSLCKRLPVLKRDIRGEKSCGCLIPEEAENLNDNIHGKFEGLPVSLCAKKLGCTPVEEDREAAAGGGAQTTPRLAAPQPSIGRRAFSLLKTHLHCPRGAQEPKDRCGDQMKDSEEETPSQGCSRRPSGAGCGCEAHPEESSVEHLSDLGGSLPKRVMDR